MLGEETAEMDGIPSGERNPVDTQIADLIFPIVVLSVYCWVYWHGPAPPTSQSLKSIRPISDSSVFFSGRELSHTKHVQVLVIALVDLIHGEIFGAHHVEPRFHVETVVCRIGHNWTAVPPPQPELFRRRLLSRSAKQ